MDLLTTKPLEWIYNGFKKIREVAKTLDQNKEDGRHIEEVTDLWETTIRSLVDSKPQVMENPAVSLAVASVQKTLVRAGMLKSDGSISAAWNAGNTAKKLGQLRVKMSEKISLLILAVLTITAPQPQASCSTSNVIDEVPCEEDSSPKCRLQQIITSGSNKITISEPSNKKLLHVYPRELRFPLDTDKEKSRCPVTVTNMTANFVAVWIIQIDSINDYFTCPRSVIVEPRSTLVVFVQMKKMPEPLEGSKFVGKFSILLVDVWSKSKISEMRSSIGANLNKQKHGSQKNKKNKQKHQDDHKHDEGKKGKHKDDIPLEQDDHRHDEDDIPLEQDDHRHDENDIPLDLLRILKEAKESEAGVHWGTLMAVVCNEIKSGQRGYYFVVPKITSSEPAKPTSQLASIRSVDAHPTKPWILTGDDKGKVSIWNYQAEKFVGKLVIKKEKMLVALAKKALQGVGKKDVGSSKRLHIYSTKFMEENTPSRGSSNYLAAGDGSGKVHIISYTDRTLSLERKFTAYDGKSVNSMAVHSTMDLLLTSSIHDGTIKLWNWKEGREIATFGERKPSIGVIALTFNPRNTTTFACVIQEGWGHGVCTRKFHEWQWDTSNTRLIATLLGPFSADYLFTDNKNQSLAVTVGVEDQLCQCTRKASLTEIWDLKKSEVVHKLKVSGPRKTICVACHPKLPLLATMLDDGTVCLWDAKTYRLKKLVHINIESFRQEMVFASYTPANDNRQRTWLVILFIEPLCLESQIAIIEFNLEDK